MKPLCAVLLLCTSILADARGDITWGPSAGIAARSFGNNHPRIVTDGRGNPVVLWGRNSDAAVFISKWNGSAFTAPVQVNPSGLTVATATWMGPDLAVRGDTIYVVMKQTPEDNKHPSYLTASFDGGAHFSMPVKVENIADSLSRFPTVTIDASGNPVVAFMKFNATFGDARWVVTRSSDHGVTFSPDVKASGWSGSKSTVCDCCPGSIVSTGSTVAMIYRDNLGNTRDIWAGMSADDGSSFEQGMGVDRGKWVVNACPGSGPDGTVMGDTLYTAYMSGTSGMNMVYFSAAALASRAGATGTPLTGMFGGLSSQNYPRIASSGTALAVVWTQSVRGADQLGLRFTSDVARGFPAGYDTVDLANVTNADVALAGNKIFVVWEDDNSGTLQYRSGTFTTTTSVVAPATTAASDLYPMPASDVLAARVAGIDDAPVTYAIVNLLGKEVAHGETHAEHGLVRIDLTHLLAGQYFLNLRSGGHATVVRAVKQ